MPDPVDTDNGLGETVAICLRGDEFYSYGTDEAGSVLIRDGDGLLRYVEQEDSGEYGVGSVVTESHVNLLYSLGLDNRKVSQEELDRDKLDAPRETVTSGDEGLEPLLTLVPEATPSDPLADKTETFNISDVHAPGRGYSIPLLVVLVDFSKTTSSKTGIAYTCQFTDAEWSSRVFGDGGVSAYYSEVSDGNFTYTPAKESGGAANDGVIRVTLPIDRPLWLSAQRSLVPGPYKSVDGTQEYNIYNDSTLMAYAWNAADDYKYILGL